MKIHILTSPPEIFFSRARLMVLTFLGLLFPIILSAQPPSLQKPGVFRGDQDLSGWVMSEKLDGIRGYWDGRHLVTRKGRIINSPSWFTKNFPPFELDGELWSSRGQYEFIQSVVLDAHPGEGWKKITYNIFEVPNQQGYFFQRLGKAKLWFASHPHPWIRIIEQIPVKNKSDLDFFYKQIESNGGEGVIVKDPLKPYDTGRSTTVLKVKKARDMEGEVIAVNPGQGRNQGVMGSLTLRLENGVEFKLGTGFTDKVRQAPPPIGTQVTFKYHGFTKTGVPKFASFLRIRED
ncbi:DNA ligase [uncultured Desulfobacter sp.]|uniref:DNA ligase n=1 Tax=uncultured Desulfobacter sp. TaxID=240139 RepID=UPI002AAA8E43|nr:DNA ligase [uncultured Desulfobacter sp.]